jgi:hypothetical protein
VKLQEGDALPSSTDEVCDMIITFVQVEFQRGPNQPQQPVGTAPVQPRPPSAPHKQTGGGGGTADRTADEPAGGACCHVM